MLSEHTKRPTEYGSLQKRLTSALQVDIRVRVYALCTGQSVVHLLVDLPQIVVCVVGDVPHPTTACVAPLRTVTKHKQHDSEDYEYQTDGQVNMHIIWFID